MTARASAMAQLTCQRAFQGMARQCLATVRQRHAAACRGSPDAIHQIRIALTKLRAAQKFFAAMTRDTVWPKLKAEIRWLNSALGAARDSDVTTAYARAGHGEPLAARSRKLLSAETVQNHKRLTSVLRSKRCGQLLAALEHWIDGGPWSTTGAAPAVRRRTRLLADYAPDRLQRWKRRLVRRSTTGLAKGRRRHRLRIDSKRYRYMCEAVTAMGLPESRTGTRERKAAQSIQGALGELRDVKRFRDLQPDSIRAGHYRRQKNRLLHKAKAAFQRLR